MISAANSHLHLQHESWKKKHKSTFWCLCNSFSSLAFNVTQWILLLPVYSFLFIHSSKPFTNSKRIIQQENIFVLFVFVLCFYCRTFYYTEKNVVTLYSTTYEIVCIILTVRFSLNRNANCCSFFVVFYLVVFVCHVPTYNTFVYYLNIFLLSKVSWDFIEFFDWFFMESRFSLSKTSNGTYYGSYWGSHVSFRFTSWCQTSLGSFSQNYFSLGFVFICSFQKSFIISS